MIKEEDGPEEAAPTDDPEAEFAFVSSPLEMAAPAAESAASPGEDGCSRLILTVPEAETAIDDVLGASSTPP